MSSIPINYPSRSGLPRVTCSCVGKSDVSCKDNVDCTAKTAAQKQAIKQRLQATDKYTSHARVIVVPPQLVRPSPISFLQRFSASLHDHTKIETRRVWGGRAGGREHGGHFLNQKRALDEHLFVRAWCGKKGCLIGYILYHSITPQRLGDMTLENVQAEGGGDMSVKQFRTENFGHMSDEMMLYVVRFTFIPLHQDPL